MQYKIQNSLMEQNTTKKNENHFKAWYFKKKKNILTC